MKLKKIIRLLVKVNYFIKFMFTDKVCPSCSMGELSKEHGDSLFKENYKCDNCNMMFV